MSNWFTVDNIKSIVRHALTFVGGALLPAGVATGSELELIIGGITTLVGVLWSYMTHKPEAPAS